VFLRGEEDLRWGDDDGEVTVVLDPLLGRTVTAFRQAAATALLAHHHIPSEVEALLSKWAADKRVMSAAVDCAGSARVLRHASAELRADRDVVLAAVRRCGDALRHASDRLRADREVVTAAVTQWGGALLHAAAELQGDRSIAALAGRPRAHSNDLDAI
jgi:hypothetical protein